MKIIDPTKSYVCKIFINDSDKLNDEFELNYLLKEEEKMLIITVESIKQNKIVFKDIQMLNNDDDELEIFYDYIQYKYTYNKDLDLYVVKKMGIFKYGGVKFNFYVKIFQIK